MKVKVKISDWDAGLPVIMLRKKTARYLGVHSKQRLSIKTLSSKPKQINAIVDIFEKVLKEDEVAVSKEVKEKLNLHIGQKVEISLATLPKSLGLIKEKLIGRKLSKEEIELIIKDIVENNLSESEIALFISGMYKNKMTFQETINLIKAILNNGEKISFKQKYIVDKHCIGGLAGNRTTPIVVAICASQGLIMPKTSSRAITSAAGTADVIETISPVDLSMKKVKEVVKKTNACMVWGGGLGMVPADSKIISIEKELGIDPEAQLLASVMAKKLAVGSKYILIDIPYGKYAKVTKSKAEDLKFKFQKIGNYFGVKMKVVLTKGDSPLGRGVGPILEMKDVLDVLNSDKIGPKDLEDKSTYLAGQIFEMSKMCKKGKGQLLAKYSLETGQAFEKFNEIIIAQGGKIRELNAASFQHEIKAKRSGKVKNLNNRKINQLARVAGCPIDKGAGVYLNKKKGEKFKKGDTIITLYSDSKSRLGEAINFFEKEKPFNL